MPSIAGRQRSAIAPNKKSANPPPIHPFLHNMILLGARRLPASWGQVGGDSRLLLLQNCSQIQGSREQRLLAPTEEPLLFSHKHRFNGQGICWLKRRINRHSGTASHNNSDEGQSHHCRTRGTEAPGLRRGGGVLVGRPTKGRRSTGRRSTGRRTRATRRGGVRERVDSCWRR